MHNFRFYQACMAQTQLVYILTSRYFLSLIDAVLKSKIHISYGVFIVNVKSLINENSGGILGGTQC
jgi:hypothetical protein